MGNINKKGLSNVDWKRRCAPLNEGGFEIRSIRLANASFAYKLTWDLLTTSDKQAYFLHDHFFHMDGWPRTKNKASSIRSGIHEHIGRINDGSF